MLDTSKFRENLELIVTTKMPYGKYAGYRLCDIPEHYLVWMKNKGFPKYKLGMLLEIVYEMKLEGLDYLISDLKRNILQG